MITSNFDQFEENVEIKPLKFTLRGFFYCGLLKHFFNVFFGGGTFLEVKPLRGKGWRYVFV